MQFKYYIAFEQHRFRTGCSWQESTLKIYNW